MREKIFLVLFLTLVIFGVLNWQKFVSSGLHQNRLSPASYSDNTQTENNQKLSLVLHGNRDKKEVALTFDADMTQQMAVMLKLGTVKSWYNKPVIETLDRENVHATIFLTGLWAKLYPEDAKKIAEDPLFEIGNHSYDHPGFTRDCYRLSFVGNTSNAHDEVQMAQDTIKETTGITPKYFRFPGGCYRQSDLDTINKLGLTVVHWDVAANDGFNKNPDSVVKNVLTKVQNGSIVVFHLQGGPFAPKTNEALVKIIPELKKRGFEFVTISQMLKNQ